jgi:hypothetical protein
MLNMILAVLIGAFKPENIDKFDKDEKDERIEIEKERFKRLFARIGCCFKRSANVSPGDQSLSKFKYFS